MKRTPPKHTYPLSPIAPIALMALAISSLSVACDEFSFVLSQSVVICRNWSGRICRFLVHNPTS